MNSKKPNKISITDVNQENLYFLTKAQLIDLCLEQKGILNYSEQMLENMASQLSQTTD